jgi:hypothetical protein
VLCVRAGTDREGALWVELGRWRRVSGTVGPGAFLPFTRYHHVAGIPLEEATGPAPGAGRGLQPPFGMNGADWPVKCRVRAPNIDHTSLSYLAFITWREIWSHTLSLVAQAG